MLTIFTPTYNRLETLERLYESLLQQTNKEFEWVVVDDGSTDSTNQYLENIQKDALIVTRHYTQKNSGKMQAYNVGLSKAEGDYFICLDSDDYLTNDAVQKINESLSRIDKSRHIGIVGLKRHINGNNVGTGMPEGVTETTLQNLYNIHHFKGDTLIVYDTAVAKKYLFPQIDGEKFIPESYIYDQLDNEGLLMIMNYAVYVCEYLDDGYSKNFNKNLHDNPQGFMLYNRQRIGLATTWTAKLKACVNYDIASFISGNESFGRSMGKSDAILCAALYPSAMLFYVVKRRKV